MDVGVALYMKEGVQGVWVDQGKGRTSPSWKREKKTAKVPLDVSAPSSRTAIPESCRDPDVFPGSRSWFTASPHLAQESSLLRPCDIWRTLITSKL